MAVLTGAAAALAVFLVRGFAVFALVAVLVVVAFFVAGAFFVVVAAFVLFFGAAFLVVVVVVVVLGFASLGSFCHAVRNKNARRKARARTFGAAGLAAAAGLASFFASFTGPDGPVRTTR
jgi:hypothetical protein